MSTAVAQGVKKETEPTAVFVSNGQEVRLSARIVKTYLTRGNEEVTDAEVVMFINLCKFQELNPFLNEAYLVKFKGSPAQLVVAKEAYMKRAESIPEYEGFEAGLILQRENEVLEVDGEFKLPTDKLLGGWARVYRSGRKVPYVSKVSLSEYDKGQSTWKSMPCTMIRKTAIVHALKEAFPVKLLAGDDVLDEEPTKKEIASNEIRAIANKGLEIGFNETENTKNDALDTIEVFEEPEQQTIAAGF